MTTYSEWLVKKLSNSIGFFVFELGGVLDSIYSMASRKSSNVSLAGHIDSYNFLKLIV